MFGPPFRSIRASEGKQEPRPAGTLGNAALGGDIRQPAGTHELRDDAQREFAYGPASGLPDSEIGTFPQSLMDVAKERRWNVISMKNDWKHVFAFEE